MALKELLTDPKNFKFYAGGQGHSSTSLKFGQRSIPFGNDRPGGGSSKQPFITTNIPPVNADPSSTFPDFLLRDPKNALNDRADDLSRITQFLTTPQGLLFIGKQQLLSLQNPIVPGRPNRQTPLSGLYNPLMTLAQTAGAGTGLHIEKQGLYPIFGDTEKYFNVYKTLSQNPLIDEKTNRLTQLYNSKKLGLPVLGTYGVSNQPNLLLSYLEGANVNLTGKTNIPLFNDSRTPLVVTEGFNYSNFKGKNIDLNYNKYLGVTKEGLNLGYFTGTATKFTSVSGINWNNTFNNISAGGDKLENNTVYYTGQTFPDTNPNLTNKLGVFTFRQRDYENADVKGKGGSTSVQDFRKQIIEDKTQVDASKKLLYTDYTNRLINKETRVGLGNPGKRTRNRSKLISYDEDTVDRINMIPLYYDNIVLDPLYGTRDLIKFRFEVIDNAQPSFSTFIHFRAFLGAITDNFKAEWNTTKYIGRGDNFYNYRGFGRDIGFSFKVHPQSRAEMKSIYQKLQYLASSLAPDYSNGYMKGNLIRLTIGDYLYIVPGFITSLTYTIPEDSSWEIALNDPENGDDKGLLETPKLFEVNVSFTPIHDFVPQVGNNKNTALITPSRAINPYLDDTKTYDFGNNYSSGSFSSTGPDSFNATSLKQFATNGSTLLPSLTIPVEDQINPETTNFAGNTPPVNANAL